MSAINNMNIKNRRIEEINEENNLLKTELYEKESDLDMINNKCHAINKKLIDMNVN
jgi:hypothetical protein